MSSVPYNYTFNSGMTNNAAGITGTQFVGKLVKTFVVLCSTAAASTQYCQAGQHQLESDGATMLRFLFVNVSAVDASNMGTQLVSSFNELFQDIEPDLLLVSFTADTFQSISLLFTLLTHILPSPSPPLSFTSPLLHLPSPSPPLPSPYSSIQIRCCHFLFELHFFNITIF
eukprot:Phypoly_transcript_16108.p1 GENE.Phypoly_transcript_16108~~Phypoly_transcript_16108.p1  ORF type:complete len:171 (+),score=33.91 Phypoly_transcript_16108:106-618(+)